jgi:hypothetical protein
MEQSYRAYMYLLIAEYVKIGPKIYINILMTFSATMIQFHVSVSLQFELGYGEGRWVTYFCSGNW